MAKLDAKALGLSIGILWGASLILMGLCAPICPWAQHFVNVLAPFYVGYKAGLVGSLIGGVWGFVDGGIGGLLVAWLYNKFVK